MAAPHAAGLGLYLLGLTPNQSPSALCAQIKSLTTKDKVQLGAIDAETIDDVIYNGIA